eukprot:COSAG06_NODE_1710_length_8634_cov_767.811365_9_plen_111_part_00
MYVPGCCRMFGMVRQVTGEWGCVDDDARASNGGGNGVVKKEESATEEDAQVANALLLESMLPLMELHHEYLHAYRPHCPACCLLPAYRPHCPACCLLPAACLLHRTAMLC